MTSVVHIAGMSVQIGLLLRQRCAWCSYTLINHDLSQNQVRPQTWLTGALVEVDGDSALRVAERGGERAGDALVPRELPPNTCCLPPRTSSADAAATRARFATVLIADNKPLGAELAQSLGLDATTTLIVCSPLDLQNTMLTPDFDFVDQARRMPAHNRDTIIRLLTQCQHQQRGRSTPSKDQASAQRSEG